MDDDDCTVQSHTLLSHSDLSYKICNSGLSSDRKEHKMNSYMEVISLYCTILSSHVVTQNIYSDIFNYFRQMLQYG